jgi:hypothetical protein
MLPAWVLQQFYALLFLLFCCCASSVADGGDWHVLRATTAGDKAGEGR